MEQVYFTDSMPLLTPNHSFNLLEREYFTGSIPLLTPNQCLERDYFTGSIPLLTPNHSVWSESILQVAYPCLPPTTVLGARVFYRWYTLAYPQPQCLEREYFTGSIPLLTPNHSVWSESILQVTYPCLPQTTVLGARVFYRWHTLAYLQPQCLEREYFTGSIPLLTLNYSVWSESILQVTYSCLPPTTVFGARVFYR